MRRSVLVTGANSGIGLATSIELAALGFHTLGVVRSDEKAQVLLDNAQQAGVEVAPLVLDVTDADACDEVLAGLDLYGLVNNAGYYNAGAVEDVPPADVDRQLDTMVAAPMRLAQAALPAMRQRGQGRIVNVASAIVHLTGPITGWYQASKKALSAVSDALRIEVAPFGVEVVLIEPGAIDSNIWVKARDDLQRHRPGSPYADAYNRAISLIDHLHGRMAAPSTVAEVIGQALTVGRPRAVYRVNADAAALRWASMLVPPTVRDRLIRMFVSL